MDKEVKSNFLWSIGWSVATYLQKYKMFNVTWYWGLATVSGAALLVCLDTPIAGMTCLSS